MINLKRIVGVILLLGILLPSGVIALTDTFQQYNPDTYPLEAEWWWYGKVGGGYVTSGPGTISYTPYYDTQSLYCLGHMDYSRYFSTSKWSSTYVAFTAIEGTWEEINHVSTFLQFYKDGVKVGSVSLKDAVKEGFTNWDRYEIYREGNKAIVAEAKYWRPDTW